MATYTPNYGLHQWVPEDQFRREDFNQDFQKIDAAIKAAENKAASGDEQVSTAVQAAQSTADRALAGLEPLSYNVYNLLLQNYYEGKSTQYKKALYFDGFQDKSGISSLTGAVWDASNPSLLLDGVGQGNYDNGYDIGYGVSLNKNSCLECAWTASGNGLLTAISLCIIGQARLDIRANGQIVATYTMTAPSSSWPTLPLSLQLTAGTTYKFCITNIGDDRMVCSSASASYIFGYRLTVTPKPVTSGSVTGNSQPVSGTFQGVKAWVRHTGGTPVLSVKGNSGSWKSLSKTGTRTTVNSKGVTCTESSFLLASALTGPVQAKQDNSVSSGTMMRVYDYGVMFF